MNIEFIKTFIVQTLLLLIAIGTIDGLPQESTRQSGVIFHNEAFDSKHQHPLSPVRHGTDIAGLIVQKMRKHYLAKTSKPSTDELDTTVRPTIIDSISKIKKRSTNPTKENHLGIIIQNNPSKAVDVADCPCPVDATKIRDGIAEHSVFESDIKEEQKVERRELDEMYVQSRRKRNIPGKEKIDQQPTTTTKFDDIATDMETIDATTTEGKSVDISSPEPCSRDNCTRV